MTGQECRACAEAAKRWCAGKTVRELADRIFRPFTYIRTPPKKVTGKTND